MIRLFVLILVFLPLAAMARPAKVTTGDHDGFTRMVIDFGTPVIWQIGRTPDGYELQLPDLRPAYDLSGLFNLIGRNRLAAAWVDPDTGALRIGVGCACYAMPFEFRPGIVVIDVKDGPPPKGSSFEQVLSGANLPGLQARSTKRPRARPTAEPIYDWMDVALANTKAPPALPIDSANTEQQMHPDLQPLREVLLQQLSRGAAQGVIDMTMPSASDSGPAATGSVRTAMGTLPGVAVEDERAVGLMADGGTCITDAQLDISDWAEDGPIAAQMAGSAPMLAEFDVPDAADLQRAVRFYLHIGFGAEARQLLRTFRTQQADAAIWVSMAYVLDDERQTGSVFQGMAACDSASALWALLSTPPPEPGKAVNQAAALRSFSALPAHLRRQLGPLLVDRFIGLDDFTSAQTVRDAVLRAPGDGGPGVELMDARLEMQTERPESANQILEGLIATPGPTTPEALLARVDLRIAQRQPMSGAEIVALEGLWNERKGGPDAPRYARAVTLARAAAGDFDGAFAGLQDSPGAAAAVWQLLADLGPDSALLTHAVLPADATHVPLPPAVAMALSARLSALGMADAAGEWLLASSDPDVELASRIALQKRDARLALRLIAGKADPALLPVRVAALSQLGDDLALSALLAQSGDEAGSWRALTHARDWIRIATDGPSPWKEAAATVQDKGLPFEETGSLAKAEGLLEATSATRLAVDGLLAAVMGPEPGR